MPASKRVRRTVSGIPALASYRERTPKKASMTPSELRSIIRKELSNEIEEKHGIY